MFLCLFAVVIFLYQGEKGESCSPGEDGEPHQGAIKFSDTADICILSTAGTVRYSTSQNALQLCDGSAWLSVVTAGKGHVAYNPGTHCLDILDSGEFLMEQHIKILDCKELRVLYGGRVCMEKPFKTHGTRAQ